MSEDHTTTDYQPGRDLFLSTDSLTHWRGCDAVHPDCVHPAVAILSDLIAELREMERAAIFPRATCSNAADRAEARLKGLNDV